MKTHDIQQNTPAWFTIRTGLPTASEFSSIVTSSGEPSKSRAGYAKSVREAAFEGPEQLVADNRLLLIDYSTHLESTLMRGNCKLVIQ